MSYKPSNADPVCDPHLAKRSTLEQLAVALDGNWSTGSPDGGEAVKAALDAYRIECRMLRTKAEVDADIVAECREYHGRISRADGQPPHWNGMTQAWVDRMNRLCAEPTTDQPSNGTAPGGAEARTPSEPAPAPATALEESAPARGGSHPDDRPCGCEDTEALQAVRARLRSVVSLLSRAPIIDPDGEGATLGQCDLAFAVLAELQELLVEELHQLQRG